MMDALSSLSFGLPPLIEYDTSASVSEMSQLHAQRIESIQGCAAIFAVCIIKINVWRAHNDGPPATYIWEAIEADVWRWEAQPDDGSPDDSWKSIARLAIKEGWRHAVLIYLYMVRRINRTVGLLIYLFVFVGNVPPDELRSSRAVVRAANHESARRHTTRRSVMRTFLFRLSPSKSSPHSLFHMYTSMLTRIT